MLCSAHHLMALPFLPARLGVLFPLSLLASYLCLHNRLLIPCLLCNLHSRAPLSPSVFSVCAPCPSCAPFFPPCSPQLTALPSAFSPAAAVAFRLYDIGNTGAIERSELKRFLIALMVENPDIELDEQALDEIVDEVRD